VLDEVLDAAGGDVAAVPAAFDAARRADAQALYEIDRKAYSFFRRRGPFDPDFLQLLSHVLLGTVLSKIIPFLYGARPALLTLGSRTPYSKILGAVTRDAALTAAIVLGGLLFAAARTAGLI
jgi:ubiquitin carboxyl-terminal hydrolase 48